MTEPIRVERVLSTSRPAAFAAFVDGLAEWWPQEYTFAGDRCAGATIEPVSGGRWFERDDRGHELDWGVVADLDPDRRITLTWRVAPDRTQEPPERASTVEATFSDADEGTRVVVEHRDLDRHGEPAAAYRDGLAAPEGWPLIVDRYADYAASQADDRRPTAGP